MRYEGRQEQHGHWGVDRMRRVAAPDVPDSLIDCWDAAAARMRESGPDRAETTRGLTDIREIVRRAANVYKMSITNADTFVPLGSTLGPSSEDGSISNPFAPATLPMRLLRWNPVLSATRFAPSW